jgi:hypothetical protein
VYVQGGAGGQSNWSLEPVNYEGWRVIVDEGEGRRGWLLLRQSLHDPLLVLNVESDQQGGEQQGLLATLCGQTPVCCAGCTFSRCW